MPHFSIEYSANLDGRVDIAGLCAEIHRVALEIGLFEIGGIRVRAIKCETYAIADKLPENAFVDLSIKIGRGRALEARKQAGEAIFAAMADYLQAELDKPHFALSMEIRELEAELSWKKNSIHPRLRGK